jgi:formate dehydrogenase iron-sulfur subunit
MHCEHPACASACPTTALNKTPIGAVVFDEARCIGCRACMQACPFLIPKYDYDSFAPKIHKCTFCADRLEVGMDPACATVCPTGAITFGDRDDMVVEAKRRIAAAPGTYIPEIYGLDEVGGTSVLHLSSVPFEQIGYITGLPKTSMPDLTHRWLRMTAPVFAFLYAVFGALNWIVRRRMRHQGHEGEHT